MTMKEVTEVLRREAFKQIHRSTRGGIEMIVMLTSQESWNISIAYTLIGQDGKFIKGYCFDGMSPEESYSVDEEYFKKWKEEQEG